MDDEGNDLTCPITLELLEDAVASPCCGRTFSREALRSCLARNGACPLCRVKVKDKFPAFDTRKTPELKIMASLVDRYREKQGESGEKGKKKEEEKGTEKEEKGKEEDQEEKKAEFNCSFQPIHNRRGEELSVGKLTLDVAWHDYQGDVSLFIPIIDRSGSMSRSFCQVQEALLYMHFLTFQNRLFFFSFSFSFHFTSLLFFFLISSPLSPFPQACIHDHHSLRIKSGNHHGPSRWRYHNRASQGSRK